MLHVLRLTLPNVYLLTGERAILIDAGAPKDVPRILAFLQTHGIEPSELSLILLTHGHWDHAGGAAQLKAVTMAPIALHRADADLVRKGHNGSLKPTCLMGRLLLPFVNRGFPAFEPDVLIDEEMDLSAFGVAGRVLFTPGHTPGSISVLTNEGEAIVGDLLMGGWFGGWLFPSRPGLHYFAEDVGQLHASIGKVVAVSRVIHPGHGGPLDPSDVASRAPSGAG
jgi:glyoxylase-like metal-dependent hydrolase (beta-lactamase superfamily II)